MTPSTTMTRPETTISTQISPACKPCHLEVRWSSLVHPHLDTGNLCGPDDQAKGGKAIQIDLVLSVQLLEPDHLVLEAWLERPRGRRPIFSRLPLACRASFENGFMHLDCQHEGRRLLSLTLAQDDSIAYAQCDLLAEAGFRGGSYDPPFIRHLEAQRDAASA